MKYQSIFDITGPIMVGPSSSHTAGAVRIGQLARIMLREEPRRVEVKFLGSFASTYRGHGTDVAIAAGVMGWKTSDPRIPDALEWAKRLGLEVQIEPSQALSDHPNTAELTLVGDTRQICIVGVSIGGGVAMVTALNGFPLHLTGESPALIIAHRDEPGSIAAVTKLLAENDINVAHMEVSRRTKGDKALMVIETDESVPRHTKDQIRKHSSVMSVIVLDAREGEYAYD